jgi:membrane protein required for beta-lactamase induction
MQSLNVNLNEKKANKFLNLFWKIALIVIAFFVIVTIVGSLTMVNN